MVRKDKHIDETIIPWYLRLRNQKRSDQLYDDHGCCSSM